MSSQPGDADDSGRQGQTQRGRITDVADGGKPGAIGLSGLLSVCDVLE